MHLGIIVKVLMLRTCEITGSQQSGVMDAASLGVPMFNAESLMSYWVGDDQRWYAKLPDHWEVACSAATRKVRYNALISTQTLGEDARLSVLCKAHNGRNEISDGEKNLGLGDFGKLGSSRSNNWVKLMPSLVDLNESNAA